MDSTSTCHCSNLKIKFEELRITFLIQKFEHSTTVLLRISIEIYEGIISMGILHELNFITEYFKGEISRMLSLENYLLLSSNISNP